MSENANAPWRDEETLRQKYWVEGKSLAEVGDELGCSQMTVSRWLEKHGLGKRSEPGNPNAKYRDPEVLEDLYHNQGLSTIQIANELECSKQTVQKWMKRNDIETRQSFHDKNGCFFTDKDGYEYFAVTVDYETISVSIHRLLAVATGLVQKDKIRDKETNIHHKNGVPWDNRPENLECLSVGEHAREHAPERERNEEGDFL